MTGKKKKNGKGENTDEEARLSKEIWDILSNRRFAVLATRGEKYPYCTLVGFAASEDLTRVIFATKRLTRKYANIKADKHISMLIDTRSETDNDLREAKALTLLGEAGESKGRAGSGLFSRYLRRHRELSGFAKDPNTAIIIVKVNKYILVSRFQEVFELVME